MDTLLHRLGGAKLYIINESKSLDEVLLILEPSEAKQLIGYLKQLLESDSSKVHHHLSDDSYQKEITVCLIKDVADKQLLNMETPALLN